ncbi:hypothetical protein TSAR_010802 [Trichomalopsis sarcophagae]|uniref:Uncharacterized protein n=1 Tax=Trichomalopsis sarcophagae TaxID=543379 RepID=A0A232EU54_9HYME|nr:hypothetical protein TSAR_010802 [Trichomalopsis sarcophagae]
MHTWRVLNTECIAGPDCGTFLMLSIPRASVRLLRQRNFQLNCGLGWVTVKVYEGPQ